MDVIIEGKITIEEGIDEVLRTCAEIKSVKTPILRINDGQSELQGRIAFSQGGYIIGGMIGGSGETGYPAIRRLLMINEGNYAILDPLRKHIADVNQSLWIRIDRLLPMLPNLPEDPDGLVDSPHPSMPSAPAAKSVETREETPSSDKGHVHVTVDAQSKMRSKDVGFLRIMRSGIFIIIGFSSLLGALLYRRELIDYFSRLFGAQ